MKLKGLIKFLFIELILLVCIITFSYLLYDSVTKYRQMVETIPHMSGELKYQYFFIFGVYAVLITLCIICKVGIIKIYKREKYI